ncbi:MAG TPA: mechanosensitive ion channel family protein [Firmicutes bacterium]|nr:mechanosensitive ion channel family protein [Bacillota bacterium]
MPQFPWMPSDKFWDAVFALGKGAFSIIITVVAALILLRLSGPVIDRAIARTARPEKGYFDDRRVKTLALLLKSAIRYAIYFFAGMAVISKLGVDTASLLAGAGLAGLAIGFGAQSLVKDVINGFFILFEDQFGVGDYVGINDVSGIVEDIGLRVTRIRDFGGQLHIVPNSQISRVTNYMGSSMRVLFEVGVAYDSDVDHVLEVLARDFEKARTEIPGIVEGPTVLGVSDLAESAIKIMVIARTQPMEQWRVERELKKRIKQLLDREGIIIPYPHMNVIIEGAIAPQAAPHGNGRPDSCEV